MLRRINKKGSLVLRHLRSSGIGNSNVIPVACMKSSGKFLATHRFYSTEQADIQNELIRNIGIIAHIDAVRYFKLLLLFFLSMMSY
jgi:hypothetical protein